MITEDYVSYEIAKLLKEKGFDEVTNSCYSQNGNQHIGERARYNSLISGKLLSCPTLQMAMKWLREKHQVFIQIELFDASTISGEHTFVFDFIVYDPYDHCKDCDIEEEQYNTYEQAVEAALKYSLENLI